MANAHFINWRSPLENWRVANCHPKNTRKNSESSRKPINSVECAIFNTFSRKASGFLTLKVADSSTHDFYYFNYLQNGA
jgi:hypothetical protein